MAVYAMQNKKYPRSKCRAMTFENVAAPSNVQADRVPCMLLAKLGLPPGQLALLNMVRKGLFGEIVTSSRIPHHDCIDHCSSAPKAHALGRPLTSSTTTVLSIPRTPSARSGWMDLGAATTSTRRTMANRSGINDYFKRKFGAKQPYAKAAFARATWSRP